MDEKGKFFGTREKKMQAKHDKRCDKLAKEFQEMCEKKVIEITTEYEQKLDDSKFRQADMMKTLQEKQRQLEVDYIRISDHETIVNERQNYLQKSHELEMLEMNKKYETEMQQIKLSLEGEIQRTQTLNSEQLKECQEQIDNAFKTSEDLKAEKNEKISTVQSLRETLDNTRDQLQAVESDFKEVRGRFLELERAHNGMLQKFDKAQVKKVQLKQELATKLDELTKAERAVGSLSNELSNLKNQFCLTTKELDLE